MPSIAYALSLFPLPRSELRLLLMQLDADLTHARMVADPQRELSEANFQMFCLLAQRRLAGEPIAYLLGAREFYGRRFCVTPAVLIPRPETEHLIDAALQRLPRSVLDVVDLGCGSGAIALTLALEAPCWRVRAVELSHDALALAQANAQALQAKVEFFSGSWFDPLPTGLCFDLIVSNPPYIAAADCHLDQGDVRFEPRLALTDEADGLSCFRLIAAGAVARLKPGGWLMVEHGYDQAAAVRALFASYGLRQIETLCDLAGCERVTIACVAIDASV